MLLYGSLPIDTRVDREIRALVKKKHSITILDTEMGHGKWKGYEGAKRIPIIRLPVSKRQSFGGLVRFWLTCFKYLYRSRKSIDVVHVHDLTGLPPAWLITTMVPRIKFVYDSHELFPEAALDRLSVLHYAMFLTIEMICAHRIDYLISVSPVILKIIARRVGGAPVLLMNVPDLLRVQEKLGEIPRWSRRSESSAKRIVYSGGVLHRRGYDELVQAARILTGDVTHKYEFWIVGDGPYLSHIKSMVKSLCLTDSFVFTGRVEFEDLLSRTSQCDIAVCLYSDPIATHLGMSNKMFEYMMLGMPFLYPDAKQSLPVLESVGAVIVENPITVTNLVESIVSLLNDPDRMTFISEHGRQLVMERFNWQIESQKLTRIYESILSSTK
jgi:glycosyltransferase involved in cell wall biosynthesis